MTLNFVYHLMQVLTRDLMTGRDTGRGSEGIDGKPSGTLAVYVQHLPPGGNILFLLKRGETGAGRQG
ncbi:hypothetical protein TSAR_016017 [Trichomalopsis sarcophagae]|uniref:Uncharacterized protein n=1 Tax=Trichomalopsis sarcophagae TaxID=543379 RepID=A0A232ENP0_9HYME|nr:hypothetical protein TSAR_016017 [Trichomalopsis sarcophagae]